MIEPDFDWLTEITRVYREVVGGDDNPDGMQRQDAFDIATDKLLGMTETGELKIPLEQAIRAALAEVDRREGQRTDTVLRRVVAGQEPLDLDDDPFLEVVVTLGGGLRKPWRDVTQADLRAMDQLRYRNYRQAATAYDEWRTLFDPTFDVLGQFNTFGLAVAAGAFK